MSRKQKTPRTPPRSWRDIPDSAHANPLRSWPSPESLHPGEETMIAAIFGDESARAIITSYRQPVIATVTQEALEC